MPSFVCDTCQETLKKPKLDQHAQRCRRAIFSCIDCGVTFKGTEYQAHFSCITEVQKHHLPKGPDGKILKDQDNNNKKRKVEEVSVSMELKALQGVLKGQDSMALKGVKKALGKTAMGKKAAKKWLAEHICFSLKLDGQVQVNIKQ